MNNYLTKFVWLSLGFVLVACDQSIESRLQNQNKNKHIAEETDQLKTNKLLSEENKQVNMPAPQLEQSNNERHALEPAHNEMKSSDNSLKAETEKMTESASESKTVDEMAKANMNTSNTEDVKPASVSPKKDILQTKTVKHKDKKANTSNEAKKTVSKNKKVEKKSDKHKSYKVNTTLSEGKTAQKSAKTSHTSAQTDGSYENGKLVSNFSEEELRVGVQRPLSKESIKYYKMKCRYAFMSEQDVIENNCQTKKVTFAK